MKVVIIADPLSRKERIARVRKLAAKSVKTPAVRIWLERDEFGGLDKTIGEILDQFEPKRTKDGISDERFEQWVADYAALLALEAFKKHLEKRR